MCKFKKYVAKINIIIKNGNLKNFRSLTLKIAFLDNIKLLDRKIKSIDPIYGLKRIKKIIRNKTNIFFSKNLLLTIVHKIYTKIVIDKHSFVIPDVKKFNEGKKIINNAINLFSLFFELILQTISKKYINAVVEIKLKIKERFRIDKSIIRANGIKINPKNSEPIIT